MAITPLYNLDELNTEITEWKACLKALASGKSYTVQSGGTSQTYTAQDIDTVRKQLEWFQQQRTHIESSSRPSMLIGRPRR